MVVIFDEKVSADGIQFRKNVALRSAKGVRSDVVNGQIALHDLQSGKIRESSNRSTDGEVAVNTRNFRYIARNIAIVIDEQSSKSRRRNARLCEGNGLTFGRSYTGGSECKDSISGCDVRYLLRM